MAVLLKKQKSFFCILTLFSFVCMAARLSSNTNPSCVFEDTETPVICAVEEISPAFSALRQNRKGTAANGLLLQQSLYCSVLYALLVLCALFSALHLTAQKYLLFTKYLRSVSAQQTII